MGMREIRIPIKQKNKAVWRWRFANRMNLKISLELNDITGRDSSGIKQNKKHQIISLQKQSRHKRNPILLHGQNLGKKKKDIFFSLSFDHHLFLELYTYLLYSPCKFRTTKQKPKRKQKFLKLLLVKRFSVFFFFSIIIFHLLFPYFNVFWYPCWFYQWFCVLKHWFVKITEWYSKTVDTFTE